ncbi:hypothetical protein [Microbacterium lacus]|uniref:hypothetical protein n=1 Tax=Microbacterium lacus TaxID=415217 RepID=UPI000C2CCE32|nr:hypothetical protein [Microbacterium lacus]
MSNDAGNTPTSLGQDGSGNPDTDRAYLQDEPPVQVDPDAPTAPAETDGDEPGTDADAARG